MKLFNPVDLDRTVALLFGSGEGLQQPTFVSRRLTGLRSPKVADLSFICQNTDPHAVTCFSPSVSRRKSYAYNIFLLGCFLAIDGALPHISEVSFYWPPLRNARPMQSFVMNFPTSL